MMPQNYPKPSQPTNYPHQNQQFPQPQMTESYVPGMKKVTSKDKNLIWDVLNSQDLQNENGVKFLPKNNKLPQNSPRQFQSGNQGLQNQIDNWKDSIAPGFADSILVDTDSTMGDVGPENRHHLPKINQHSSLLALSNVVNLELNQNKHPQRPDTNIQDFYQRDNEDPRNDQKGDHRQWKNWVITSFIPKPPVNGGELQDPRMALAGRRPPPQHESMIHKSISFVASSRFFNQLKTQCESKGVVFVDKKFPPEMKSLVGFGESKTLSPQKLKSLVWKKPKHIFKGRPYSVFSDRIRPSDIVQGMLGDCYFLSAISAIAEKEDRIKKIFLQREISRSGAYCVALCLNGIWEEVIIDEFFPCMPNSGRPAFNSSRKNDIWVMLLEKAWAKVHGGYLNIDGGLTREALHDLTGSPTATYYTDELSFDKHWDQLLMGDYKDFIMTCGSHDIMGTGKDHRDPKTGLCGNHAYSLLSAHELSWDGERWHVVKNSRQRHPKNVRLVQLRNPWGKGEWLGEWSDNDKRWTRDLLKKLGHQLKDDGKFFMPFKMFMKYFHDYQICYFHDDYLYSGQRFRSKPSTPTYIKFQVKTAGVYYFSVNQINKRFFRKKDSKFKKFLASQ